MPRPRGAAHYHDLGDRGCDFGRKAQRHGNVRQWAESGQGDGALLGRAQETDDGGNGVTGFGSRLRRRHVGSIQAIGSADERLSFERQDHRSGHAGNHRHVRAPGEIANPQRIRGGLCYGRIVGDRGDGTDVKPVPRGESQQ